MRESEKSPELSLRERYRSFLASSVFQIVVVRGFSLIYFMIFYRLIGEARGDLGVLVFLSVVLMSFGVLSDFGLYYSLMQWGLTEEFSYDRLFGIAMFGFWVYILPLNFVLNFAVGWYVFGGFDLAFFLYLLNAVCYSFFTLVRRYLISKMHVEREYLLLGGYSILNSVLVPVFYYYYSNLSSVLFAWLLSLVGSIGITLVSLRTFPPVWRLSPDFPMLRKMIGFGLPVFLTMLLRILTGQIDRFLTFVVFEPAGLGLYSAMRRIVEILTEAILVVLAGVFPIFSKLFRKDKERGTLVFFSVFRLVTVLSVSVFGLFYVNRVLVVHLLIGSAYDDGLVVLQILILAHVFVALSAFLEQFAMGFEKRMELASGTLLAIICQVLVIFLLLDYGILASAIGLLAGKLLFVVYFLFLPDFRSKLHRQGFFWLFEWFIASFAVVFLVDFYIGSFFIRNGLFFVFFTLLTFFLKPLQKNDLDLIQQILPQFLTSPVKLLYVFSR